MDGSFPDQESSVQEPWIGGVLFRQGAKPIQFGSHVSMDLIEKWIPRKSQIAMVELFATVVALATFKPWISNTWSLLFVDSEPVQGALVKGYSSRARVAITASYQAHLDGFHELGVGEIEAVAAMKRSVELAREAAPSGCLVAGSVGSYGASLHNGAEYTGDYPGMDVEKLLAWHRPRAKALLEAGCDLFACETVLEPQSWRELHTSQVRFKLGGDLSEDFATLEKRCRISQQRRGLSGPNEGLDEAPQETIQDTAVSSFSDCEWSTNSSKKRRLQRLNLRRLQLKVVDGVLEALSLISGLKSQGRIHRPIVGNNSYLQSRTKVP
eukprot:s271_g40.t1